MRRYREETRERSLVRTIVSGGIGCGCLTATVGFVILALGAVILACAGGF